MGRRMLFHPGTSSDVAGPRSLAEASRGQQSLRLVYQYLIILWRILVPEPYWREGPVVAIGDSVAA